MTVRQVEKRRFYDEPFVDVPQSAAEGDGAASAFGVVERLCVAEFIGTVAAAAGELRSVEG